MTLELDEALLTAPGPEHPVAVARQVAADELADRRLVFDQENRPGHQFEPSARSGWLPTTRAWPGSRR